MYEQQRDFQGRARLDGWREGAEEAYGTHKSGKEQIERALDLLYRRKWMIALSLLVMVAVAAVYTYLQVPIYRAASFILIELDGGQRRPTSTEGKVSYDNSLSDNNFFARNDRPLSDELFVLENSWQLAQRVAQRLHEIQVVPESETPLPILYAGEGQLLTVDQVATRLGDHIAFAPVRGSTKIVQVTSTSTLPGEAILLANLYAQEYVELTQQASTMSLTKSREFLEEQLEKRREELRKVEEQIRAYEIGRETAGLDQEGRSLVSQIADLEAQRDNAHIELQMRQISIQALERELEEIQPQVVQHMASGLNQRIQSVQQRIADLEATREKIQLQYPGDQRSAATTAELQRIEQQIEKLQEEAQHLVQQQVGSGGSADLSNVVNLRQQILKERITIDELNAKAEILEGRLEQYKAELRRRPKESLERAQLERSRMYAERMHQFITERLVDARLAGELVQGSGYVRVVREAGIGTSAKRSRGRNLLMGALLGLLLGLGLAVLRDKLDNRIYKPEQLRDQGYIEIGLVPDMRPLIEEDFRGKAFVEQDGRQLSTSLVGILSPSSAVAEAYRSVRTTIQFGHLDRAVRTLLVTSPSPGEGKTVTAANLAVFMARTGSRTLLIDADLRRPQVHAVFGFQQEKGLAQLLRNGTGFDVEAAKTGIANLFVITAGRSLPFSSGASGRGDKMIDLYEVLGSRHMQEILKGLQDQVDFIVIDTPPVLAAADAALLSAQCDATIMVARAGVTREGELDEAMKILGSVGANVLGVLLNGFHVSMSFGYKYKYQNYTRYGRYSKYGCNDHRDTEPHPAS